MNKVGAEWIIDQVMRIIEKGLHIENQYTASFHDTLYKNFTNKTLRDAEFLTLEMHHCSNEEYIKTQKTLYYALGLVSTKLPHTYNTTQRITIHGDMNFFVEKLSPISEMDDEGLELWIKLQ